MKTSFEFSKNPTACPCPEASQRFFPLVSHESGGKCQKCGKFFPPDSKDDAWKILINTEPIVKSKETPSQRFITRDNFFQQYYFRTLTPKAILHQHHSLHVIANVDNCEYFFSYQNGILRTHSYLNLIISNEKPKFLTYRCAFIHYSLIFVRS